MSIKATPDTGSTIRTPTRSQAVLRASQPVLRVLARGIFVVVCFVVCFAFNFLLALVFPVVTGPQGRGEDHNTRINDKLYAFFTHP